VGLERLDGSLSAWKALAIDLDSVLAERVEITQATLSALGRLSRLHLSVTDTLVLGADLDAILGEQDGRVEVRVRVAPIAPGLKVQVRTSLRTGGVGIADELSGLNLLSHLHNGANVIVALALAVRVRDQDAVAGATRSPCGSL